MNNNRRTVRITYFRDSDLFTVSLSQGDEPISNVLGSNREALVEQVAGRVAAAHGLEVSRLDVAG